MATVGTGITLEVDVLKRVQEIAKEDNRSVSNMINLILTESERLYPNNKEKNK